MYASWHSSQTKPIPEHLYRLTCSLDLRKTAVEALQEGDFSETRLSRYQELWNSEMGHGLNQAMSYRESFLNFSDKTIDLFIRFLNKPRWLNIILQYGDVDYPSRLGSKMYLLNPLARMLFGGAGKSSDRASRQTTEAFEMNPDK